MYQTAYNATDGPLVADDFGRSVGGHEFGTVETTCDGVQAAIRDGRLHLFSGGLPQASGPQNPDAIEAENRTQVYAERAETLHAASKEDVLNVAREAGLIGDEDVPHKTDLIGMLTPRVDIQISDLVSTTPPADNVAVTPEPEAKPKNAKPKESQS